MSKFGYMILAIIVIVVIVLLAMKPKEANDIDMMDEGDMVEETMTEEAAPVPSTPRRSAPATSAVDEELFSDIDAIIEDDLLSEDSLGSVFSETGSDELSDFEYGF
jgi:hypothetical protein